MLPYACAPETVFSVSSDGRRPSGEESFSVPPRSLYYMFFFEGFRPRKLLLCVV